MTVQAEREAAVVVGSRHPRLDAEAKVTGHAPYAADIGPIRQLHCRLVLSPYAHARIVSIDGSGALEVAGVRAVLTAADLPILGQGSRAHEPLAREEVVFAGQPVALVVGETEAAAEDGVEHVLVDYEPLEPVVDARKAAEAGSPLARTVVGGGDDEVEVEQHTEVAESAAAVPDDEAFSGNVATRHLHAHGDVEAAFAACAAIAEARFETAWVHQGYLEPQVAVAWPEGRDGLAVYSSTQTVFMTRQRLAQLLGLPLTKIRVEAATLGGGFGAKIAFIEPLVAAAALRLGVPVQLAFTRSEDFAAANPCPGYDIELKIGARADGMFAAIQARVFVNAGAWAEVSSAGAIVGRLGGPYRWGAWDMRSYAVRTNLVGQGAYRGPTAPQAAFALESLIDDVAGQLGLDPIDLRIRNASAAGETQVDGLPAPPLALRETLAPLQSHPLWEQRADVGDDEGVGLAVGVFPGARQGAAATCRMDADGGLTVLTGYVDMTGTATAAAAIAAETFGVPIDQVRVVAGDSSSAPQSGLSGGSMVTYCLGNAVRAAAQDAREQLFRVVAEQLEIDPADLEIAGGEVRPVGSPDRGIALAELGAQVTALFASHAPVEGHGAAAPPELAPSIAAALVHVRVDRETGEVELLRWVAAQDCGRAINPALIEGQMRGGAAQAIGFALYEELLYDEEGQPLTGSFMTYAMPRSTQVPAIETVIVEVPAPYGPLGAKGVGESALAPGAAAVANAVAAATGVRLRRLPMSAKRIWSALADGH